MLINCRGSSNVDKRWLLTVSTFIVYRRGTFTNVLKAGTVRWIQKPGLGAKNVVMTNVCIWACPSMVSSEKRSQPCNVVHAGKRVVSDQPLSI